MSCTYTIKGKNKTYTFSDELALDDWLLKYDKYLDTYGDFVFSIKDTQIENFDKLREIDKKATEVYENNKGEWVTSEDGKSREFKLPYIGVNKYLSNIEIEGHRLFPEFVEENYWEGVDNGSGIKIGGRYGDWKQNQYSKEEATLFFGDSETIAVSDPKELIRFRRMVENKWENLCLIGSAVHSVYEAYFKLGEDNEYRMSKLYNSDGSLNQVEADLLFEELKQLTFERKKYKKLEGEGSVPSYSNKSFEELVNRKQYFDILSKCRQLEKQLKSLYGENTQFLPEFKITGSANKNYTNADLVIGIIDLLVMDEAGLLHVVDYKTSPKPFESTDNEKGYNSAKKLAYMYLVGTYGRLLAMNGFATSKMEYLVVPIQLLDYKKVEEDKFEYSQVGYKGEDSDIFDDNTNRVKQLYVQANLDVFADYEVEYDLSTEDLLVNVSTLMREWFPKYALYTKYEDKLVEDLLKADGAFKLKNEQDEYEWNYGGKLSEPLTAKSEAALVKKAKDYLEKLSRFRKLYVEQVTKALKEGIQHQTIEGIDLPNAKSFGERGINSSWFKLEMERYCNENWQVCEGDVYTGLNELGIIVLKNKKTRQLNFLKVTTQHPKLIRYTNEKAKGLTGNFEMDVYLQYKQKNLMLQAVQGNIELMETMLAINTISKGLENGVIGEILVVNPHMGLGLSASNKELLYSFNELNKHKPVKINRFASEEIKMGSKLHLANTMLLDIMTMGKNAEWEGDFSRYKGFTLATNMMQTCVDLPKESQIAALEKLIALLSVKGKDKSKDPELMEILTGLTDLKLKHVSLYNLALLALAELKNIDFRLLLRDHDRWCETILKMPILGFLGTYMDNPGNLNSETLNLLTKLVTEAYQNVRLEMTTPVAEIRKLTEALEKEKHFGVITKRTIGNAADLYKNMFRDDIKEDLLFKDPWKDANLSEAERNYLKYVLLHINKNRFGERAEEIQYADPDAYFRVPLAKGDSSTFASLKGLLSSFKNWLKGWNPKTAYQRAKDAAEGFFDNIDSKIEKEKRDSENLFEMNNIFDKGEREEERLHYIEKRGKEYFELNIETLFLKHEFAYSMLRNVNQVMPMIKASMVHLATLGASLNTVFNEDLKYAKEYILNKIKNESIINPKYDELGVMANKVKRAASTMVLALSPVQAIYQTLQGLWNDVSIIWRKPDGSNAFTKKNMIAAGKLVYSDLFKSSDVPTKVSLLNELYGINDMDMNTYTDRIKSDKHGIHNFTSFLYKFASRPDYYNRMTLFTAKMIEDGCLDAHKIVDGKLKYVCEEDKRYSAYLKGLTTNKEYAAARARYLAAARLFEAEHAKNEDGTDFKVDLNDPKPLPRAYTNLESESMKSISDTVYGYYSHEKKSMIQSTIIGGMWMQFKTYWSGKKNLYFAGGGVKLEGNWVHALENGLALYYKLDALGNPTEEITTEVTEFPVWKWEGNWKEGIMLTLWDIVKGMPKDGPIKAIKDHWNHPDYKLRLAYQNNMKLFMYDMVAWIIIGNMGAAALGDWLADEKKEMDKDNVMDGLRLSACNIAIKSLQNSFLDFNFIDSISSIGTTWTPFAFEYYGKQLGMLTKVATGNMDLWDAMVKSTATTNSIKPFFDTIKPEWAHRDTTKN